MGERKLLGMSAMAVAAILVAAAATAEAQWSELAKFAPGNREAVEAAALAPAIGNELGAEPAPAGSPRNEAIVGSWIETVTISGDGPPPFQSLNSFSKDGSLTVADQGNVTAEQVFSAGHGSWRHLRQGTFEWTVVELVSAPDGSLIGTFTISGRYTVGNARTTYSGHFLAQLVAPSGEIIFAATGTNQGRRIAVESLP